MVRSAVPWKCYEVGRRGRPPRPATWHPRRRCAGELVFGRQRSRVGGDPAELEAGHANTGGQRAGHKRGSGARRVRLDGSVAGATYEVGRLAAEAVGHVAAVAVAGREDSRRVHADARGNVGNQTAGESGGRRDPLVAAAACARE